jgi:hypothetical protein
VNFRAICTSRGGAAFTTLPNVLLLKSPSTATGPKNALRDGGVGEGAQFRSGATRKVIWFIGGDTVAQFLGEQIREVRAANISSK